MERRPTGFQARVDAARREANKSAAAEREVQRRKTARQRQMDTMARQTEARDKRRGPPVKGMVWVRGGYVQTPGGRHYRRGYWRGAPAKGS